MRAATPLWKVLARALGAVVARLRVGDRGVGGLRRGFDDPSHIGASERGGGNARHNRPNQHCADYHASHHGGTRSSPGRDRATRTGQRRQLRPFRGSAGPGSRADRRSEPASATATATATPAGSQPQDSGERRRHSGQHHPDRLSAEQHDLRDLWLAQPGSPSRRDADLSDDERKRSGLGGVWARDEWFDPRLWRGERPAIPTTRRCSEGTPVQDARQPRSNGSRQASGAMS